MIIYCPSLSQGQLIKLAQHSFVSRLRKNSFSESAGRLITMICKDLIEPVAKVLPGLVSGDLQEFHDFYEYITPELRVNTHKLFKDLRYWPNEVVFRNQINFWNVAAFKNLPDALEPI